MPPSGSCSRASSAVLSGGLVVDNSQAITIATQASDKVYAMSTPLIGLAIALLILTIGVGIVAFLISRLPKE